MGTSPSIKVSTEHVRLNGTVELSAVFMELSRAFRYGSSATYRCTTSPERVLEIGVRLPDIIVGGKDGYCIFATRVSGATHSTQNFDTIMQLKNEVHAFVDYFGSRWRKLP